VSQAILIDFVAGRVYKPGDAEYERVLAAMMGRAWATKTACIGATPPQRDAT
jgi:hypothetical protein